MKNLTPCPKCNHAMPFDTTLLLSGGSCSCKHCDHKASLLDESKRLLTNTTKSLKERRTNLRRSYFLSKTAV